MSVKHALLALLTDGPRYGYELKSEFEAATGHGWALNIGQVYSTLQRLERDALIEPDGTPDAEGRQSYLLTSEGRLLIENWLATPLEVKPGERDEMSLKVLIALATDIRSTIEVAQQQRVASMGYLQMLTARKATPMVDLASRLHLDRTILLVEAQIRWLDLVESRLEAAGETHQSPPNARLNKEDK